MLSLVAAWLGLWLVCLGLGAATYGLAFRFGGSPFRVVASASQILWVGVALLLLALQLVSLVAPLRPGTLLGIGVLSFSGAYRCGPLWGALLRGMRRRGWAVVVVQAIVVVVVLALVANSALQPTSWYDTNSTHIQQAKWAATYGTPLGLGNLNPKFGFDQAHHLLAAAMSKGPFSHRTCHTAVPFLVATLVLDWTLTLMAMSSSPRDLVTRAFVALTVPFIAGKVWTDELASLSGDLAMASLFLPALREILRLGAYRRRAWSLLVTGALGGALFAVKFSAMPVTVSAVVLLVVFAARRRLRPRSILVAATPLVLLLVATCVRRILITGWLVFPIPFGNLHLPWSIPRAETLNQYVWIKSWARIPGKSPSDVLDHGFFHWFLPWFDNFRQCRELTVACFAAIALVARTVASDRRTLSFRATSLALVVAVACLAYWFIGAPDRRFGAVFLWTVPAVALAPLFARTRDATVLLVFVAALTWWNDGMAIRLRDGSVMPVDQPHATKAITFRNPDGTPFSINVPVDGDICGDAPLPCSPFFSVQKMRTPGRLDRGYRP